MMAEAKRWLGAVVQGVGPEREEAFFWLVMAVGMPVAAGIGGYLLSALIP